MNPFLLSQQMMNAICRMDTRPRTAAELGVNPSVMLSLLDRGYVTVDSKGRPNIYRLSPLGHGAHATLSAPPALKNNGEGMVARIQRIVANYYSIPVIEMVSKRRARAVARPRQVAMWLAKSLTTHSLPTIGHFFGGRDHTTVIHAIRVVDRLCESDPAFCEEVYGFLDVVVPEREELVAA
jgi:hypothetical protein